MGLDLSVVVLLKPTQSAGCTYKQGTHCTGKTGKMVKRNSLSGKTQGIWKFCQNTGYLFCSSCKFPDSKGKRYSDICSENFQILFLSWISLPSKFCVCNSHKSRILAQGKLAVGQGGGNWENTGNLKRQCVWVPWYKQGSYVIMIEGPTAQGKQGKWLRIPCHEKHEELGNFAKILFNLFLDSKNTGYRNFSFAQSVSHTWNCCKFLKLA